MGLGHVPTGEVPRARSGADLSRRERRTARTGRAVAVEDRRRRLGWGGEAVAAWFLSQHGMKIVDRNVEIAGGEVDLIAVDGTERVLVEVRSTRQSGDPIDRVDNAKRNHVRHLAAVVGASRVDLIGVRFDDLSFDVHWVPGAN